MKPIVHIEWSIKKKKKSLQDFLVALKMLSLELH